VTGIGSKPLLAALRDIDRLPAKAPEWEALVRRAREADLLGTLAFRLHARGTIDGVPDGPRAHFIAARVQSAALEAAMRRETREIDAALRGVDAPIVLLKGAAYLLAGLPPARGRYFSDVDILMPKHALPSVESALMLGGFATTHLNPYDQRYYRRWLHELPPMQHVKRLTVVDVHHTLAPIAGRLHPDATALLRAAVPLGESERYRVLEPADMVLHSATHLFGNEDFTHGLRDLVDVDALLRHFADAEPRFFDRLVRRAMDINLERPLYYALRWTARLLGTPVPAEAMRAMEDRGPGALARPVMDVLLPNALLPDSVRASTRWARRALYVRGHWLKMPLPRLAWHLAVKSLRREEGTA
jgi:hypothetical protein